mmetsp:Transcript_29761/g.42479  ORF Transcript_29761/g.42479 Transcript_29761/m.42479 type:complete len:371 (-) Transcript_29761:55-1167(-)
MDHPLADGNRKDVLRPDSARSRETRRVPLAKKLTHPFGLSSHRSNKVYSAPYLDDIDGQDKFTESNPLYSTGEITGKINLDNQFDFSPLIYEFKHPSEDLKLRSIFLKNGLSVEEELDSANVDWIDEFERLLQDAINYDKDTSDFEYSQLNQQSKRIKNLCDSVCEYTSEVFVTNFKNVMMDNVAKREGSLECNLFLLQVALKHKDIQGLKQNKSTEQLEVLTNLLQPELDQHSKKAVKGKSSRILDKKIENTTRDLIATIKQVTHQRFRLLEVCLGNLLCVPLFITKCHSVVENQFNKDNSRFASSLNSSSPEEFMATKFKTCSAMFEAIKSREMLKMCNSRKQKWDALARRNAAKAKELQQLLLQCRA